MQEARRVRRVTSTSCSRSSTSTSPSSWRSWSTWTRRSVLQYASRWRCCSPPTLLKSNISSIFYIGILGYLQSENPVRARARAARRPPRRRRHRRHGSRPRRRPRPPDALLETDHGADCPTRRFWLNCECGSEFVALAEEESARRRPRPRTRRTRAPAPPPAPDQDVVIAASVNNATDVGSDEAFASRGRRTDGILHRPDLVVMLMLA